MSNVRHLIELAETFIERSEMGVSANSTWLYCPAPLQRRLPYRCHPFASHKHCFPPCYPYTYPISPRWVIALTFLHSALWIKAQADFCLFAASNGLMEATPLACACTGGFKICQAASNCLFLTAPKTFEGAQYSFFLDSANISASIFFDTTTSACIFLSGLFFLVFR